WKKGPASCSYKNCITSTDRRQGNASLTPCELKRLCPARPGHVLPVTKNRDAVQHGQRDAAAKLRALERRPATLVEHLLRVDARLAGQIDGHEVGVIPLADEAALDDPEQQRRIVRGLLHDLRQSEQALGMLLEQHQ